MQSHSWLRRDARWAEATPLVSNTLPVKLRSWLLDKASLTQRLIEYSGGRFEVRVLEQGWQRPLPSEAEALACAPYQYAFVRQVHLLGAGVPWVYARTVIPIEVARGRLRGLTHLGTRPLGAVLFSNPTMYRGNIEVARIPRHSGLNSLAHRQGADVTGTIWGRRSLFHLYNLPLLVSEIYLNQFPVEN